MGLGMSESLAIDSPFRGWAMPKSYSADLRERVIEAVEMGASRHEAADRFEVSVSSAVKWLQRWDESRSAAPKPRGGSVSPLEKCATRVLASQVLIYRRRSRTSAVSMASSNGNVPALGSASRSPSTWPRRTRRALLLIATSAWAPPLQSSSPAHVS